MSPISTLRASEAGRPEPLFPVTTDDGDGVFAMDQWRETDIEVTLDSGCCNHVLDAEDAPGYVVQPSAGSRRGQNFIVGNGEKIPNEGQVRLNMQATPSSGPALSVQSTFQVAEVNRPLMSVSRICDQGSSACSPRTVRRSSTAAARKCATSAAPTAFTYRP